MAGTWGSIVDNCGFAPIGCGAHVGNKIAMFAVNEIVRFPAFGTAPHCPVWVKLG